VPRWLLARAKLPASLTALIYDSGGLAWQAGRRHRRPPLPARVSHVGHLHPSSCFLHPMPDLAGQFYCMLLVYEFSVLDECFKCFIWMLQIELMMLQCCTSFIHMLQMCYLNVTFSNKRSQCYNQHGTYDTLTFFSFFHKRLTTKFQHVLMLSTLIIDYTYIEF
jgi:hypothetical protein